MHKVSVYIVDDHQVLVDGLSVLLSGESFIEIVGKNTINEMINAGVNGYILKNSDKHEVLNAIAAIDKGEQYLSETVTQELLKANNAIEAEDVGSKPNVTSREREIIQLIAKEYSNAQIAKALFISERTVETHRKNIFRKTNTKSVVGLLKFAMEQNYL